MSSHGLSCQPVADCARPCHPAGTRVNSLGPPGAPDAAARDKVLKEITYQNDGMVDPSTVKKVGKQIGADLMIFGNIYMKAETRDGKTIKQYTVNLRMTDIEKGIEVLRVREKLDKYSEQKATGW